MNSASSGLPLNTKISHFEIVEQLGVGGFAYTYKAWDLKLERFVAIKEYFPRDWAIRASDGLTVLPKETAEQSDFEYGLERFLQEARVLAQFNCPNIVSVKEFLQLNGTAYFVMSYEEGQPLDSCMESDQFDMSEEQLERILLGILTGLQVVHTAGYLHRDIKPANIYIRNTGDPVLLDFGAARYTHMQQSKLTAMLTPGYGPIEQYDEAGKQGPWTDFYALGATLYHCLFHVKPPFATTRVLQNPDSTSHFESAIKLGAGKFSVGLLEICDWLLQVNPGDRPQDVQAVLDRFARFEGKFRGQDIQDKTVIVSPRKPRGNYLAAAGILLTSALVLGIVYYRTQITDNEIAPKVAPTEKASSAEPIIVKVLKNGADEQTPETGTVPDGQADVTPSEADGPAAETKSNSSNLTPANVNQLLQEAQEHIDAARYILPAGNNAADLYRLILDNDPDNKEARAGLRLISDFFLQAAETTLAAGAVDQSIKMIKNGLTLTPGHSGLLELEAQALDKKAQLQ